MFRYLCNSATKLKEYRLNVFVNHGTCFDKTYSTIAVCVVYAYINRSNITMYTYQMHRETAITTGAI